MTHQHRTPWTLATLTVLGLLGTPSCDFGPYGWGDGETATSVDDLTSTDGTTTSTSGISMTTTSSGNNSSASETEGSTSTDTLEPTLDPSTSDDPTSVETTAEETMVPETDTDSTSEGAVGCQQLDVLLVLDGSQTMAQRRFAIETQLTELLEGIGAVHEGVNFRVGVTHDHDGGLIAPECWEQPNPWVESSTLTTEQMVESLECAFSAFTDSALEAPQYCEHSLTSAVNLLETDASGFLRDDALLTVVILTDVDDYGNYDLDNLCGGCDIPGSPEPVGSLLTRLEDAKGNPMLVTSLVLAGDPAGSDSSDGCGRSGSCGCDMFECTVYDGQRLLDFSDLLGVQGRFSDLCGIQANGLVAELVAGFEQVVSPACASL